ncbi:MAG: ABC transporter ATP-binding protein [Eubacteriaceae bacterium]
MIDVNGISLKCPNGKGVFDLNFRVKRGEAFGCIGPNGAGKTEIIQILMGFVRPNTGTAKISGLNCTNQASAIQRITGYVPSEPAFFERMKVKEYLKFIGQLRGKNSQKHLKRMESLIEQFELEKGSRIDQLSNDMLQKLSIVTAFMDEPKVYLLDEPTKYLDASMQTRFIDLILEEKKNGKTLFMTSHIFEEIERVCDTVAILKDGKVIEKDSVINIKAKETKAYLVKFASPPDLHNLTHYGFEIKQFSENDVQIFAQGDRIDLLVKVLSHEKILAFNSITQTIEDNLRLHYQKGGK